MVCMACSVVEWVRFNSFGEEAFEEYLGAGLVATLLLPLVTFLARIVVFLADVEFLRFNDGIMVSRCIVEAF